MQAEGRTVGGGPWWRGDAEVARAAAVALRLEGLIDPEPGRYFISLFHLTGGPMGKNVHKP